MDSVLRVDQYIDGLKLKENIKEVLIGEDVEDDDVGCVAYQAFIDQQQLRRLFVAMFLEYESLCIISKYKVYFTCH